MNPFGQLGKGNLVTTYLMKETTWIIMSSKDRHSGYFVHFMERNRKYPLINKLLISGCNIQYHPNWSEISSQGSSDSHNSWRWRRIASCEYDDSEYFISGLYQYGICLRFPHLEGRVSEEVQYNIDYVSQQRGNLNGHKYTSIGTNKENISFHRIIINLTNIL